MRIYILIFLSISTFCCHADPEVRRNIHHVEWSYVYEESKFGDSIKAGPKETLYYFDGQLVGKGDAGIKKILEKLYSLKDEEVIFYLESRSKQKEAKAGNSNFPKLFGVEWLKILWTARENTLEIVCKATARKLPEKQ
ncbi:MAG: hypothetical protein P1U90_03950 [Akkermansiaceae bacterium]|jgi:hypothetical protein|nr:hypothetical protein [Akkermansiaceae bacterium]